jgi:hypothetical protein
MIAVGSPASVRRFYAEDTRDAAVAPIDEAIITGLDFGGGPEGGGF